MRLNRYFREHETFPHPNISIEVGRNYHSAFLEPFLEFELELRKWTNKNLAKMICKSVRNFVNESLLLAMYETYLQDSEKSNNHPSIKKFLEYFGISKME